MNIKEAKEQILNAMKAYFTKNSYGGYVLPIEAQRPIFLMGPPGIGKTAIMQQIASELDVALVSYSMTHHTRQSALGLPFIEKKIYDGKEYSVSEYTMSEIIATVYDTIEATGKKEGILFLDEINCVSETLAPIMLQFLQYKVFGRHRVPDGWIVVTAGNPPEYNNSVREYDIVTWDRLKRMDVEPDFTVWKEYAYQKGVHASIITYLDIKKTDFYKIETTVNGKTFVTARGWVDLSDMMKLYEQHNLTIDEKLIGQYLQNKKIAKEFAIYYDLFNKYKSDYQIDQILAGKASPDIITRAQKAKFDERLALLGLILDGVWESIKAVCHNENGLTELMGALRNVKMKLNHPAADAETALKDQLDTLQKRIESGKLASALSADAEQSLRFAIDAVEGILSIVKEANPVSGAAAFALIKAEFDKKTKQLKKLSTDAAKQLSNAFVFCEEAFGEGQEILILVTELTINAHSARFISRYGCKEYFAHNKELLFYERQKEIIQQIEDLKL